MPRLSIAGLILPVMVLAAVTSALWRRTDVYSEFLKGAEDGMKTVMSIFAPLLGILTAAAMLRESGLLSEITALLSPLARAAHIPDGAVILALMRPVSGGGSLGILSDIINTYGADSITALTAAVMMGSTETTLYTLSVYFKNTSVKNTRRILVCALLGDIVCAAASGIIAHIWFGQ